MLRWTSAYCKDIKLIFKLDDDSFVVPHRFTKWLLQFEHNNSWPSNSIIGKLLLSLIERQPEGSGIVIS